MARLEKSLVLKKKVQRKDDAYNQNDGIPDKVRKHDMTNIHDARSDIGRHHFANEAALRIFFCKTFLLSHEITMKEKILRPPRIKHITFYRNVP
jgi:hypothetical protein